VIGNYLAMFGRSLKFVLVDIFYSTFFFLSFCFFYFSVLIWGCFDRNYSSYQFLYFKFFSCQEKFSYCIGFGIDGISLIFLWLTSLLFVLIFLTLLKYNVFYLPVFCYCLLSLEFFLFAVFTAVDFLTCVLLCVVQWLVNNWLTNRNSCIKHY
jgi:NADH:ubiquinone oxidoreductase subunit 4 (subunit M)